MVERCGIISMVVMCNATVVTEHSQENIRAGFLAHH